MADKIVSPGVFTKENDLSFLQQGVADIGAAFIGPFKQGPVVPTIVNSQAEFETLFGTVDGTYYTPLAVQNYLREAGSATICRVVGNTGYIETAPLLLIANTSQSYAGQPTASALGILFNTSASANVGFAGTIVSSSTAGTFNISGAQVGTISASLNLSDVNDIEAVFGASAYGSKNAYAYGFFKNPYLNTGSYTITNENGLASTGSFAFNSSVTASVVVLGNQKFSGSYGNGQACEAKTPVIKSQLISGDRYSLFRFETIGVGNAANTQVKIGITNIKAAGTVAGTDYGTFTVVVRDFNDTDKKKSVLETYSNVNLDPNSPNYIARVIGDRKLTINGSNGKITESGDWVNKSKYIRVASLNANAPVQAVPFAHTAYQLPISASATYSNLIPRVTFTTSSVDDSIKCSGIDLDNNNDNAIYLKPIPQGAITGSNVDFSLDSICGLTVSSTLSQKQFVVALQEGFDGMSPAISINKGDDINAGNSQGFDLVKNHSGYNAYMNHINALSNSDEWDVNMVVVPGVNKYYHNALFTKIVDMVESRADAFFIGDMGTSTNSLSDTIGSFGAADIDSNYVGTYYPWIKTIDVNTNKLITVPPSVLMPGVFAANDRVAAEWFAPAGLNRGGLTGAVSVLDRLTQSEKDSLYEAKVNPIVQFPGQGIVVFGQKTLQDRPSALDRINVRRLLLTVRKYIASTSRYLVFEQNTAETRNRFLNIVNPYLESIQQRQGLYAFKVVMDDSNNTPDVIDRNIMKGAIYLQPTKTAEFIQIDFNILPTGAAFNG